MQIDVLGPMRVRTAAGPAAVPRGRSTQLLCCLTLRANESVSVDWLVSVLWTNPPATAAHKVRTLLRDLVPLLDPGALELGSTVRLVLADEAVDAWRFTLLVREATAHLTAGDTARAAANFAAGLELWRGDPYPELGRAVAAMGQIDRLIDLRLGAIEDLNGLVLREQVGYPFVAELRSLVVLHPDRPRLRVQLALYRTDRQVEALDVLRTLRHELGDEDGTAAILQTAILRHDPALAGGEPSPAR